MQFKISLPPRLCKPNGPQGNWHARARAKAEYKEESGWLAVAARGPMNFRDPPFFSRAAVTFTVIRKRQEGRYLPRDADNALASLKAAIDGFKDAALFKDDSPQYVEIMPIQFRKPLKGEAGGIEVQIEEMNA